MSQETQQISGTELESMIDHALKKVGGSKENDLCRYLPAERGGYMHHFTLRKMKFESPEKLGELIGKFILTSERPSTLPPKQRMPRGSRKRKDAIVLEREVADKIIQLARETGRPELVAHLSPPKSISQCKRELIQAIKAGRAEQRLWDQYCEAVAQSSRA
jgi:hypothetical protein